MLFDKMAMMTQSKKVLVFSPVATHPPHRGNRQRILQMATLFKDSGHTVDLAVGKNRTITPEARAFWSDIHALKRAPRWLPTRKTVPLDAWYTPGLGEELAEVVESSGASIVLFNYIFHTKALEFLPPGVFSILDTHDVFTNRSSLHKSRKYSGGFFSCTPEDEKTYLDRANAVVAISADDARVFSEIGAYRPIVTLPFFKKIDSQRAKSTRSNHGSDPAKTVLTYGMTLSANDLNLSSLYEFISSVDRHYGQSPPFRVVIAGDINNLAYRFLPHRAGRFRRPWITYRGSVKDVGSLYDSVDAVIVPVTSGTGMAVKFVESLTHGVPVLSTSAGSRGSDATHPLHVLADVQTLVAELGQLTTKKLIEVAEAGTTIAEELATRAKSAWQRLLQVIEDPRATSHPAENSDTSL